MGIGLLEDPVRLAPRPVLPFAPAMLTVACLMFAGAVHDAAQTSHAGAGLLLSAFLDRDRHLNSRCSLPLPVPGSRRVQRSAQRQGAGAVQRRVPCGACGSHAHARLHACECPSSLSPSCQVDLKRAPLVCTGQFYLPQGRKGPRALLCLVRALFVFSNSTHWGLNRRASCSIVAQEGHGGDSDGRPEVGLIAAAAWRG
jgi:hypothetical protein